MALNDPTANYNHTHRKVVRNENLKKKKKIGGGRKGGRNNALNIEENEIY